MNKPLLNIVALFATGILIIAILSTSASAKKTSQCLIDATNQIDTQKEIALKESYTKDQICQFMYEVTVENLRCIQEEDRKNPIFAVIRNLMPNLSNEDLIGVHNRLCTKWGYEITE